MNAQRFWSKVVKTDGCWEWQGCRIQGYGIFYHHGQHRAHRVSYLMENGAFPADLHVLHRCDNRACVNPAHLFLGTQLDNMRDMDAKGRRWRRPTIAGRQCKHGHAMTPENTGWGLARGRRVAVCRRCRRARRQRSLLKKRSVESAFATRHLS